jgi:CO/xanthine dehydrogenase Mo-binding subunit
MTECTSAIVVGARLPRVDARQKVTGRAQYVDDIVRPGMLHAAIAQSPHAHARIRRYDLSKARALPGVKAIVTGGDQEFKRVGGGPIKDETMVAVGKVRYFGEPVAAVAATDLATARRAAQLIEIEYEVLPSVFSPDAALLPGAALLHEDLQQSIRTVPGRPHDNVAWETEMAEGDAASAFAGCAHVVESVYETQAQQHAYMETNGAIAEIDANDRIVVTASVQSVHLLQNRVAEELGVPMSKVRVLAATVGGGFGGKHHTNIHSIAAWLARATGRPVKLVLPRAMDMEIQKSRHPARITMKTGCDNQGRLLARQAHILMDGGAYADESPNVLSLAVLLSRGPYRIPNMRCTGCVAYTNKLRAGSFRGFGNPQVTFASESQIDELAALVGIDPIEMRLMNAMRPGDTWFGGQPVKVVAIAECWSKLRAARAAAPELPAPPPHIRRGVGYAGLAHTSALLGTSANAQLRADGTIALNVAAIDIGQGSTTILTQMCADVLKLSIEHISFAAADSDSSPFNWKTAASRTTYMTGRAVVGAARSVRDQIFLHAAEMLNCRLEDLELRPGGVVVALGTGRSVSFNEVAMRSLFHVGGPITGSYSLVYDGAEFDRTKTLMDCITFRNCGGYTFGAQCAEVEVDVVTGAVRVVRAWSAHDVGRAINPTLAEGQIEGGLVQGIGYALYEEMVWDDDGRLANPTLADYRLPGAQEAPEIFSILVEDPEPTGPFGAKGVGEMSIVGIAAAIANAVKQATGHRLYKLPLTPERVLNAIEPPETS